MTVPRRLHKLYAALAGYFWLLCPLCGEPFGGHEWGDVDGLPGSIPSPVEPGKAVCICPTCTRAGLGRDTELTPTPKEDTMTDTLPTATDPTADPLAGPWRAVLATPDGFPVEDFTDLAADDEVSISIRRLTALPVDQGDGDLRLPGSYKSGDKIDLWDYLYVEDGDPTTDAPARWAQAQAMAAGLNAAPAPSTAAVLSEVAAERAAQDAKWGEQNHPDGTGPDRHRAALAARQLCQLAAEKGNVTWRHILGEEVAEAMAENDPDELRAELVQVAAVATAWIEAIDRRTATTRQG